LEFYKIIVKSMQYFLKQNMLKYFKFSLKKDAQIILGFFTIYNKKKLLFFHTLFGKNLFFLEIKLPKIGLSHNIIHKHV
jgi:hypothetical protein